MKRMQSFKYELKLSGHEKRLCYRFAGACRYVYNQSLALQKSRYASGEKKLSYADLCKKLTTLRNDPDKSWLKEIHSQALQQSLKDLERAYQNFFAKRAQFPQFKQRGVHDAFRFPQGYQLDQVNPRVYLPKIGWVRYRHSREILGAPSNITVSRSGKKWYVSIQTEREVSDAIHPANTSIGIDVGVKKLATLSDGTIFESVNSFAIHQRRLAKLQREASKKIKYSQNWKKSIAKVSLLHRKISNTRNDYLHKTTSAISKNHAIVFIEDLQVRNMSKSAKGNSVNPGKNVKAKSGLNRAILDQGWFEFRRQLEYKQSWRGGMVVAVPPQYTSQTCPKCDFISAENRKTQAQFVCVACHYKNHADIVGAINIERAGHAQLACGEKVRLDHSMKQEPTEVIQKFLV